MFWRIFDDSRNWIFSQQKKYLAVQAPRVGPYAAAPDPRFGRCKTADFQAQFDKLPGLIPVQGSENQGRECEPQLYMKLLAD